jgi:DNA-binding MarR family transcriptional regulator
MSLPSNLTDHTGYWLRMVSNAVSQAFSRGIAGEGVTVAEWVFLRALYDGEPMTPTHLADRMGMTKGAISKLADRLIAKGLVTRTENETDKRAHSLSLSSAGRARIPALSALADENDRCFFEVLSLDEHRTLDRLLRALAERHSLSAAPVE